MLSRASKWTPTCEWPSLCFFVSLIVMVKCNGDIVSNVRCGVKFILCILPCCLNFEPYITVVGCDTVIRCFWSGWSASDRRSLRLTGQSHLPSNYNCTQLYFTAGMPGRALRRLFPWYTRICPCGHGNISSSGLIRQRWERGGEVGWGGEDMDLWKQQSWGKVHGCIFVLIVFSSSLHTWGSVHVFNG